MIDLNDLRVFEHVARLGSFSNAGRCLGLPRSSVSRAVARLEGALGIRLLQRTTRDVQLTPAGQALLDRCAVLLSGLADAIAFAAGLGGAPRGTLTISAGIGFGINVLGSQLPGFLDRYPEVDVVLDLSSRDAELIAERVDIAVRMGPLTDSTMVATRLGMLTRYLCASPAYLRRRGMPSAPEALLDHDLIDLPTASGRARPWLLGRGDETVRLEVKPRVLVNDALTINRLVCGHAGIAVISAYLCGSDIRAGSLVRLLPEWSVPPMEVSMVFPSSRRLSPTVRAFVDYMKEANARQDGWRADPSAAAPS